MAINLKKENYNNDDKDRFTGASEDGEIYPQREQDPVQEVYPQNDPRPQIDIRTAEETAVRVPNYTTAVTPPPKKKRLGTGPILLIIGGVLMMCVFAIGAVAGLAHEVRSMAEPSVAVTEHIYQEPDTDFVYSGENVGDIVINADHVDLDVRYGSGTDITFTVIGGREVGFEEGIGLTDEKSILTADYISDEYYDDNDYYKEDVILTLPKGFDGQVRLTGKSSDINCSSAVLSSTVDLSCADGSIYLYRVSAADIRLSSDNGTVSADTVTAKSLTAHTDNGSMYLSEVSVDGAADISTGNGHMDLEHMHFGGETVIEGNGDIGGTQLKFIGDASITCSNSDIKLSDAEFGNMTISGGNGDVYIETPRSREEYTIEASTSNGECLVENGGNGQYKLEITDRNGNVDVTFFGDSE
ncbi:MAG: DUF4097 family beta strand repeat-containing protein [Oscillospiraceae bacterium]|nr:DUF4097 family beta strand repeat-containing protein [Oscillospiraceae bacterium]